MGNCSCFAVFESTNPAVETISRDEPQSNAGGGKAPSLKIFSLAELKSATGNFREESVVGEGGFGKVFKGYIDEKTYGPLKAGHGNGIPVAIKKSNPYSDQGLKEWKAEVKFLGKFRHPNLVKLLGFCWEEKQFLLVYEFMQAGSLENHLFTEDNEGIPWETRIKIAVGAATGLAFLHSTGDLNVIYRDFKASNILLDQEFNAKISDFGLAKLGPAFGISHITTQIIGTFGYAAPEYVATGHLYVKSDVYSFGVVLLEMIMGRRVIDFNRPRGQTNLVDWAKPLLLSKRRFITLIDPKLNGRYPPKGAYKMAKLIQTCLEPDPNSRPDMKQVLNSLDEISTIKINSKKLVPDLNRDHSQSPGHCSS